MRFRLEMRLTAADVGRRVVIRWRRPVNDGGSSADEVADILGVLEAADDVSFRVRKALGELVSIPLDRALAGKTVPPKPGRPSSRQAPA